MKAAIVRDVCSALREPVDGNQLALEGMWPR